MTTYSFLRYSYRGNRETWCMSTTPVERFTAISNKDLFTSKSNKIRSLVKAYASILKV